MIYIKTKKQENKRKFGASLIELLIYMGLLVSFTAVLTNLFTSSLDVKLESESTSPISMDSRFIISRLEYDMYRAESISTPNLGSTSDSLTIVISGETYSYSILDGNLVLTNNSGSTNLNSSETAVSNIEFQRIGNVGGKNTVKLNFTLVSTTQRAGGVQSQDFSATLGTR